MKNRLLISALAIAATFGIGVLVPTGGVARADSCNIPDGCRGQRTECFWLFDHFECSTYSSGWASCDPGSNCACPLPQHDWALIEQNCPGGQVP